MYDDLKGKRALITGASRGIGAAIARRLAREGCDIVGVARSEPHLLALQREITEETGRKVDIALIDMGAEGSARSLAERFGDIDILVNNAGDDPHGSLADIDERAWRQAWNVKAFAYVDMCREYYRLMQARGGGVIVNVLGIAHHRKDPDYILGATSVASLSAFTQALGSNSLRHNIRVLAVNPGLTATARVFKAKDAEAAAMADDSAQSRARFTEFADEVAQRMGRTRAADPAEIAAFVAFAVSAQGSYLTGAGFSVDGGASRS
ncbi:short-chain dehydrogenase/reductase [Novosphingobium bradum]|uniref:Short-chain dehydrogenase/reductase n=1 Tax=Novosphingobium bradum TaxID=1737444 RepID=A0ABV7IR26_9SPHN